MVTAAKPGEAIYGVNLNFHNGILVGVQGIFGHENDGRVDKANLFTGDWLGQEPGGEEYESIDGRGKKIHGFLVCNKGFDIVGDQLIVKK